ncbi:MAG: twin-arginine translocase subunit TatC [bacterium]
MSPSDQPEPSKGSDLGIMSFGEHLEELRKRLGWALIVPLPLAIAFFFFAPYLRELLIAPLFAALRANGQTMQVQALSPAETITTDMKLAVIAALSVSAPWLLYQLWKFVSPGLYVHERRYVHFLTPLSSVMTMCGIALFYWVLLPFTLLFLVSFGAARARTVPMTPAAVAPDGTAAEAPAEPQPFAFPVLDEDPAQPKPGQAWLSATDQVLRIAVPTQQSSPNAVIELATEASKLISGETEPVEQRLAILEVPLTVLGGVSQEYRLSEYVNFTLILLAGSVIAFQMPIAVLLLGWVGLVSPKFLREKRRWAVFGMAIIAAVVTPPDVTSMLLLLIPLWLLYELGIILLVFVPAHRVSQGRVFSLRRKPSEPDESDGGWGGSSR